MIHSKRENVCPSAAKAGTCQGNSASFQNPNLSLNKKKNHVVPSETRWVTWFACSILYDDSVFDDELARKQMSADLEA